MSDENGTPAPEVTLAPETPLAGQPTPAEQPAGRPASADNATASTASLENRPVALPPVKMPEIRCWMKRKNKNFIPRLHNLISSAYFIKLCQRFEKNNIFNIVGRTQQENWHSSFIAWLLNPNGSHGLDHFPIRCLLTSIRVLAESMNNGEGGGGNALNNLPEHLVIDDCEFSETVVRPESIGKISHREKKVHYKDDVVDRNLHRKYDQDIAFDIALSTKITMPDKKPQRLVLICENKVTSPEDTYQNEDGGKFYQTEIYADYWDHKAAFFPINAKVPAEVQNGVSKYKYPQDAPVPEYPHLKVQGVTTYVALVFLSAKDVVAHDHRFVSMSYQKLYDYVLKPSLNHPKISPEAKIYLQEYIDILDMKEYIESAEREQLVDGIFNDFKNISLKSKFSGADLFYQYLSYKLLDYVFPERAVSETIWDDSDAQQKKYKKDIIGWLYYFTELKLFVWQQTKGSQRLELDGYDFGQNSLKVSENSVAKNLPKLFYPEGCNPQNKAEAQRCAKAFQDWVGELVEEIYENNESIFQYIRMIEKKHKDTIDYLTRKFIEKMSGDKGYKKRGNAEGSIKPDGRGATLVCRELPIANFANLLAQRSPCDCSYLNSILKPAGCDPYPILYCKFDNQHQHPIYINIDVTPSFVEKKRYDELQKKQEDGDEQSAIEIKRAWMSCNAICNKIAKLINGADKEKGNYTLRNHLVIYDSRAGKTDPIPLPDETD